MYVCNTAETETSVYFKIMNITHEAILLPQVSNSFPFTHLCCDNRCSISMPGDTYQILILYRFATETITD